MLGIFKLLAGKLETKAQRMICSLCMSVNSYSKAHQSSFFFNLRDQSLLFCAFKFFCPFRHMRFRLGSHRVVVSRPGVFEPCNNNHKHVYNYGQHRCASLCETSLDWLENRFPARLKAENGLNK